MNKIINGKEISKSFGNGEEKNTVLHNVSVAIDMGEFVSVMGPSGSGKSTLLYALSGMDTIDQGSVQFLETNLTECNEKNLADIRRKQMGFVFQQPTFLKNLTILDNIILPAMRDNRKEKEKLVTRANQLLEKTGISGLGNRMTAQVSGGQLQRAGICRALMSEPKIIFGDEPTGALNSKAAEEIMDNFLSINQEGTTIMLVTHDAKVAAKSERVLFMKDGEIVEELILGKYLGSDMDKRIEEITEKMLSVEM